MNILLNIVKYIFIEHLDRTSFVVSIFAIWIGYWFWKNPIDTDLKQKRLFWDEDKNLKYITGYNNKGWIVEKINREVLNDLKGDISSKKPIKEYATAKNNPTVHEIPTSEEGLNRLIYSEKI